jgi:small subunit ribosomal protein S16
MVVADARSPRDGRFIENLGSYNPRVDPPELRIDEDRALYWLNCGAQPTEPARALLRRLGVLETYERGRDEARQPATETTAEPSGEE